MGHVVTGICPTLVSGLNVDTADEAYVCRGTTEVQLNDAVFTAMNSAPGGAMFVFDDLTGSVAPSFVLNDVALAGNPANRRPFLQMEFGTGRVALNDVTVDQTTNALVLNAVNQPAEVNGLIVRDFTTAFVISNDDSLDVADSRFERGTRLIEFNFGRSAFTRIRAVNVTTPFLDTSLTGTVGLDVTASAFEGANVVFDFSQNAIGSSPLRFDLTGNNFTGTTQRVLRFVGGEANTIATTIDLAGSFFGSGDRATVVGLIEDVRTDTPNNANDDNIGRTNFAGFVASPLPLVLP